LDTFRILRNFSDLHKVASIYSTAFLLLLFKKPNSLRIGERNKIGDGTKCYTDAPGSLDY